MYSEPAIVGMKSHLEKGMILGESPGSHSASQTALCIRVLLFEIRVIIGGSFHQKLNISEVFDSKEVP